MKRIILAGAVATLLASAGPGASQQPVEVRQALVVALNHVRSFVTSGLVQVDSVKSSRGDILRGIASEDSSFEYGQGRSAIDCRGVEGCKGVGNYRGVVEVNVVRQVDANNYVIRLTMIRVGENYGRSELRVDDVYVRAVKGVWEISRVVRVAES